MLNQHQIIGRVGRDPEIRYTTGGDPVANLAVATTETWKDKNGEKQEATEWHRCVAFGRLAEIVGEYVKKGMLVYISGKGKTREWEKDGVKRYSYEIEARELKMLSRPNDGELGEQGGGGQQRSQGAGNGRSAPQGRDSRTHGERMDARRGSSTQRTGTGFDDMDDDLPF